MPLEATEEELGAFFGLLQPSTIRRAAKPSDEGKAYHWFARFRTVYDAGSLPLSSSLPRGTPCKEWGLEGARRWRRGKSAGPA